MSHTGYASLINTIIIKKFCTPTYDKDFYYTAAGDASGKARIYHKNYLMGTGYIYFVRIKTPYRCKQLEVF